MSFPSTRVLVSKDGSTEPVIVQEQLEKEAAEIRRLWKLQGPRALKHQFQSFDKLGRHKSLVLELALDDFVKHQGNQTSVTLTDYCQRYAGLGDSLERSIYDQLTVMNYLNAHPDLLELENGFDWPRVGETFLNFLIVEELGHGALARVYLCRQQDLADRLVVVKISLSGATSEASLLGKLHHPHITPVYWAAFDNATGASYLCMPFVGRSTLVDIINVAFQEQRPKSERLILEAAKLWSKPWDQENRGSLSTSDFLRGSSSYTMGILRLAVALADGLAVAHNHNVIHGDIKPSNVLITAEGRPLLIDFNLGRDQWRSDGPAGGTLAYMAPEQVRCLADRDVGSFPRPERSTDIYSFGVLLCELLTGQTPYPVTSDPQNVTAAARDLFSRQQRQPIEAALSNIQLDGYFWPLVRECLAFEPAERPKSMEYVRDRLSHHLTLTGRGFRLVRAHRLATAILVLIVTAMALGGAAYVATRPPLAQVRFDEGVSARAAGDWPRGIARLKESLELDPNNRSARLELIRCYLESGDYVTASDVTLQMVRASDDPHDYALLAYCNNLLSNPDVAIGWYDKAIANGLQSAAAMNNLSVTISQSAPARLSEAHDLLVQAVELAPESPIVRINIVRLAVQGMAKGGDAVVPLDLALVSLDWLMENLPENAEVAETAFVLYNSLADKGLVTRSEALGYLKRAVALGAGPTWKQLNSGLGYAAYRKLPEFDSILKTAVARRTGNPPPAPIGRLMLPFEPAPMPIAKHAK